MARNWMMAVVAASVLAAAGEVLGQVGGVVTPPPAARRNVILFVADGMRHSAVTAEEAPNMMRMRAEGVNFVNSHSLIPTFTMPNASALATGHLLGDTGQFSNNLYLGFPAVSGTVAIGTENDSMLQEINEHFENKNYLNETSLLATARAAGYHTAAIGKHGPTMLQDLTQGNNGERALTVIIDDVTGTRGALALPEKIVGAARRAGIEEVKPPATRVPNVPQQAYLLRVTLKAVLPTFLEGGEKGQPFVMVFWSRDPDGSQHNQTDNINKDKRFDTLGVGINGPSAKAGIRNADNTLGEILKYLEETDDPRNPGKKLMANTDVFVTSDHGFGTVSRHELSADGAVVDSFSSTIRYQQMASGAPVEAELPGFLPQGFLAIDLAEALGLPLFDVSSGARRATSETLADGTVVRGAVVQYATVDPKQPPAGSTRRMFPAGGHGVIGGTGKMTYKIIGERLKGSLEPEAKMVVMANGGSNLIYFPNARVEGGKAAAEDVALMRKVVGAVTAQKYVGAVFVDSDVYGEVPGALSLRELGLKGSAQTPVPAVVVGFRTFSMDPKNPLYTGVEIADTGLDESQGMHGSFARFDTFNNMIAIGPDFKKGLRNTDPVSNVDVAPTLAKLLGLDMKGVGVLKGRVIEEALVGGRAPVGATQELLRATPAGEFQTEMRVQVLKGGDGTEYRYRTWAGTKGRVVTGE